MRPRDRRYYGIYKATPVVSRKGCHLGWNVWEGEYFLFQARTLEVVKRFVDEQVFPEDIFSLAQGKENER